MKKTIMAYICLLLVFLSGCRGSAPSYFEEAMQETEGAEQILSFKEAESSTEAESLKKTDSLIETESPAEDTAADSSGADKKTEYCVYICGAVKTPGVYKLLPGSRIYEAVLLAGGLLENACEDGVNQAEEITDGQMIKILTKEEAESQKAAGQAASASETSEASASEAASSDGRINLNTADAAALMTLPGIGESKAKSILAYRKEKGGFSSAEEIMNITGIKEGVYSKIKEYITVD